MAKIILDSYFNIGLKKPLYNRMEAEEVFLEKSRINGWDFLEGNYLIAR